MANQDWKDLMPRASHLVSGLDRIEEELELHATFALMTYWGEDNVTRALMWMELVTGRLQLEKYDRMYSLVASKFGTEEYPLKHTMEMQILILYAIRYYRRDAQVDHLADMLSFLKCHLDAYMQFVQQNGCSWATAFAYTRLAERHDVTRRSFTITVGVEKVPLPLDLSAEIDAWNVWKGGFSLPLELSYDTDLFNEETCSHYEKMRLRLRKSPGIVDN
ncbi:ORF16 [Ranid herpesvirus 2]|uniref:ORF16 n=1 Tax=Ranid herpesvirus 2 TaxID=389214 RepID=Q14W90_9VIRU|nr:ORF16 [Ranid herpesvirus 2]ABG25673.1 ORF16 [Ranid herpesvirus 2]